MAFREEDVGVNSRAMEVDSGEKHLNELGYKKEVSRELSLFKTFAITFSTMAFFVGTPLYGPSLLYAGPASLIWGYVVVTFFTWFVGFAMAEICSSFPDPSYLFDTNNETAGALVPAQIIYDVFCQRYHSGTGAIIILCIIWGAFFFCGLSFITGAARVVYALSRDGGIPFSSI